MSNRELRRRCREVGISSCGDADTLRRSLARWENARHPFISLPEEMMELITLHLDLCSFLSLMATTMLLAQKVARMPLSQLIRNQSLNDENLRAWMDSGLFLDRLFELRLERPSFFSLQTTRYLFLRSLELKRDRYTHLEAIIELRPYDIDSMRKPIANNAFRSIRVLIATLCAIKIDERLYVACWEAFHAYRAIDGPLFRSYLADRLLEAIRPAYLTRLFIYVLYRSPDIISEVTEAIVAKIASLFIFLDVVSAHHQYAHRETLSILLSSIMENYNSKKTTEEIDLLHERYWFLPP